MNRLTSGVLAVALSLILTQATPAVGQTSSTTGAQKPSESTTDAIKGYSVEKKNEAVAHGKKLMSDLDVKIKDLEAQVSRDASAAGADAKRQANELKDLKAAQAQTAKKLDEMGKASKDSWSQAKNAFADSYKDLRKAYDDTVAKARK